MTFQKKVLFIAIIVLILALSVIGYMLHKARGTTAYPPEIGLCPDFWEVQPQAQERPGMGNKTPKMICKPLSSLGDKGNVGTFVGKEFDFSTPKFTGPSGRSAKCKWASDYNIYSDGITDRGPCIKLKG